MILCSLRETENVTSISVFCGILRRESYRPLCISSQRLGTPRSKMESIHFLLSNHQVSAPTTSFSLVLRPPWLLQFATACLTGPDTPVTHLSPHMSSGLHVQYLEGGVAPPSKLGWGWGAQTASHTGFSRAPWITSGWGAGGCR